MSSNHLVNPELQAMAWAAVAGGLSKFARQKQAFVPGGDPAMDPAAAAAGGGAPPAGGEGAPPPMDPAAGGGAPPAPPAADPAVIAQQVAQNLQQQGAFGGQAGGGGMVEPIKPKIDVNVELMQIKKMLAKLCDAQGIVIPASDMAVNSQDLTQMAMQQGGQGSGAGGGGQSAISPIQPMQAAAPGMGAPKMAAVNNGGSYAGAKEGDGSFDTAKLGVNSSKAAALFAVRRRH